MPVLRLYIFIAKYVVQSADLEVLSLLALQSCNRAATELQQRVAVRRSRGAQFTCFTELQQSCNRAATELQKRVAVRRSRGAQFTCFTLYCSSVASLLQLCCVKGEVLSLLAFLAHYWYKCTNTDAARADLERAAPRGEALLALLVQKYKY